MKTEVPLVYKYRTVDSFVCSFVYLFMYSLVFRKVKGLYRMLYGEL